MLLFVSCASCIKPPPTALFPKTFLPLCLDIHSPIDNMLHFAVALESLTLKISLLKTDTLPAVKQAVRVIRILDFQEPLVV